MDEFTNLRIFNQVVTSGSFSEAARRLGLPPSSVSRHIAALEAQLGVRLVVRTTRSMSLTEAGRLYHTQCQHVLTELQRANQMVAEFHSAPRGTLSIETRAGIGTRLVVPLLPEFLSRHPGLKVSLHLTDQTSDTLSEGVDIGLRFGLGRNSSLVCRKIATTRRVVFASPAYLARAGEPTHPADLAEHNCLAFPTGPGAATWRFQGKGGLHSLEVCGNFEANDVGALVAAAVRGLGVSVLHEWMIWDELQTGQLVRLLPAWDVTTLREFDTPIYVVYPSAQRPPAKVRALISFLTDRFGAGEAAPSRPARSSGSRVPSARPELP
jgi:DNA-binding transcriptional LysR family regulator